MNFKTHARIIVAGNVFISTFTGSQGTLGVGRREKVPWGWGAACSVMHPALMGAYEDLMDGAAAEGP